MHRICLLLMATITTLLFGCSSPAVPTDWLPSEYANSPVATLRQTRAQGVVTDSEIAFWDNDAPLLAQWEQNAPELSITPHAPDNALLTAPQTVLKLSQIEPLTTATDAWIGKNYNKAQSYHLFYQTFSTIQQQSEKNLSIGCPEAVYSLSKTTLTPLDIPGIPASCPVYGQAILSIRNQPISGSQPQVLLIYISD